MDPNGNMPGSVVSLLEEEIEPVYRYHLVRSENYLEAQNRTALTFQTALKWIDTCPSKGGSFKCWMMGIARYQQSFGRRSVSAQNAPPVAAPYPASEETSTSSRLPPGSFEDLTPKQEEILLRERIGRLSGAWKRLPLSQADALALWFFGGLTLAEVGVVLGKDEARVKAMVSREGAFEAELLAIAADLHASRELTAWLSIQIKEAGAGAAQRTTVGARLVGWINADVWRMAFRLRSIFVAGSRVAQAGLLLGILAAGLYIIQRQSIVTPLQTQPTSTREVVPTTAVQVAALPLIADAMVPPDSGTCQTWKKNLETLTYTTFSLSDSAAFTDPTGSAPAISGTGCELDATITGNIQENAPKNVGYINQLFFDNGFFHGNGFDNLPGNPASAFFPQNCPGFGRSYQKDDLYVFLSASYCPALSGQSPSPQGGSASPGLRGYILRLILTSSSVQTSLDRFFSLWASGNNQAISNLLPALRQKYPDIRALDLMVGLSRSRSKTISFIWQPVQNSGTSLRIEVVAKETDSQKTSADPQPTFQIVMAQDNELWAISDATKNILFSSTTDRVILADDQGQIFRLSLADGLTKSLSAPGIYLPNAGRTSSFPSQVSPDGRWLALIQPGPGAQAGTWLLSLDGQPAIHLNSQELNLAWSPDSRKVAYFDPLDSQELQITTLSTGITYPLAQINGIPVSLAWSPIGEIIGITFVESRLIFSASGSAGTTSYVSIGLVPLATGKIQVLAEVAADMNTLSPGDLFWTADGQELWFGPGGVAFDIRDGSAHQLIAQPLAGELSSQQADLLRLPQPGRLFNHSPESVLSPDWQNLAEVYSTTNSTNDYLAILPASVSGSSGPNQCCLEYLSGIAAFAWTGDGKNLVVYSGTDGPGTLLLVNPTSGERQTAATAVYYIGLLSSLKQAGLKLAPSVKVSRLPATDVSQTWSWVDNSVSGISLEIPSGWSIWQPGKDYTWGPIVVANLNFDNPFGFASLSQGDLYISISKVPMAVGQTTAGWYSQIESINQLGQIYTPVTIDGIRGFRRVMNGDLAPKDEIMLPVADSIVVIDKYPLISDYDLVYRQILATLNIR